MNGKNVASNFVKNDQQSWWHSSRRTSDLDWDKEREGKRRKLMGSEEVIKEEEDRLAKEVVAVANQDAKEGVEGEEEEILPKKLMINVLTSAPEGKVHRPEEPTVSFHDTYSFEFKLTYR